MILWYHSPEGAMVPGRKVTQYLMGAIDCNACDGKLGLVNATFLQHTPRGACMMQWGTSCVAQE
jgi:hypothetical protein